MTTKIARHICYDRILPADLHAPQRVRMLRPGVRAITPRGKQWVNGSTLRITFVSGTAQQRKMVRETADEWTQHANLRFDWVDDPNAQIRVHFDENDGAWSYVGTDNNQIPKNQPTLNLGWVDKAVILHEFGHMIGLSHEHQNPDGGIQWNEDRVIAELAGPPNYWDEATARHNVLSKYSMNQIHGTDFDPDSIMLYAFPGEWTLNLPEGTKANEELSKLDKEFVRGAKMYPGRAAPEDRAVLLPVADLTMGSIATPGEEDLYRFVIDRAGTYVVETEGATDVVLALFGPGQLTTLVARDDDGGEGSNARVRVALQPGTYHAAVRHYDQSKRGDYGIRVLAAL
jgi:hypothetical protein